MSDQQEILGSVETRICAAIAQEALDRQENIGIAMHRWGYSFRNAPIRKAVAKEFNRLRNPPPSPARQRAMNAQLARMSAELLAALPKDF